MTEELKKELEIFLKRFIQALQSYDEVIEQCLREYSQICDDFDNLEEIELEKRIEINVEKLYSARNTFRDAVFSIITDVFKNSIIRQKLKKRFQYLN